MFGNLFRSRSNSARSKPARRRSYRPCLEQLEERLQLTTLPAGFSESLVAGGLGNPTAMAVAPDGRVFISTQGGDLRVVKNGTLLPTPFVHLNVDSNGERGLLGIAFDPNFATDQFLYLYHTVPGSPAHNEVSRFTANGDVAVAGSEVDILQLNDLSTATNHNGGAMHFGGDGKLYISVGENANAANSQTLANLLGKMLRIDVSQVQPSDPVNDVAKLVPADNPFVGTAMGINQAIYALGLRNPFTFAVQPGTGTIFVDDVGENTWEEIDRLTAGSNYGWNKAEGFAATVPPSGLGPGTYQDPLLAYNHSGGPAGGGIAIVGGTFYKPGVGAANPFPATYTGKYFYQDLGGDWIRVFDPANPGSLSTPDTSTGFATGTVNNPVDLAVAPDGGLYYLARGSGGELLTISYTASPPPPPPPGQPSDPGFELPVVGTGSNAYAYDPIGSPWTFSGSAGVAGNGSGFTASNPAAPQGSQVAFLQMASSSISQAVSLTAGTYTVSVSAAQRVNYQASSQTFQFLVDGTMIATITPTGGGYATYTTPTFTVTAGNHTLKFLGTDPNGGDNTVFLDQVVVNTSTSPPPPPPPAGQPSDAGFELPAVGSGSSAYRYNPTGSPWTFSGSAGVAGNGSGFTASNPAAPQGSQVAFLQMASSSISQAVSLTAGTYTVSVSAAQRVNYQASSQTFQFLVDGTVFATITPTGGGYATYTTPAFTVAAGNHTLKFLGTDPNGGDNTVFLDQVAINAVTTAGSLADGGFELPGVGTGSSAYRYNPTGSPWTFSGNAGVAGNGSAFTSGNPAAPQGTQVAFVQTTGSISQTVNLGAGTFTISFLAAQRANWQASSQTVQVLVDGGVVATVTPMGSTYTMVTTASFMAAAGVHTIQFLGLNPNGGDNTAFVDQVQINQIA